VYMIFGAVVTLVLTVNEFDLAFPYIADSTSVIVGVLVTTTALKSGALLAVAVLIGIGMGLVGGGVSGAVVARGRIPSFVATLAIGSVFGGIELAMQSHIAQGAVQISALTLPHTLVSIFNGDVGNSGLSSGLLFAIGVVLLVSLIVRVTVMGRQMQAVGGNAHASFLASVPVARVRFVTFVIAGGLSALAGIVALGYQGYYPSEATPYLLQAYTAAFLGRAVWRGRGFTISGTLLAVVFLQVLSNGLSLLNEPTWIVSVVSGCVLLVAVGLTIGRQR
jgi:ribose transport system permease protein